MMQIPAPDGLYWMVVGGMVAPHPAEPDYSAQKSALLAGLAERESLRRDEEIEAALHPHRVSLPEADGRWYVFKDNRFELLPTATIF